MPKDYAGLQYNVIVVSHLISEGSSFGTKGGRASAAATSMRSLTTPVCPRTHDGSPFCAELTLLTDSRSFSPSGSSPPCLAKPLTTCVMPLRLLAAALGGPRHDRRKSAKLKQPTYGDAQAIDAKVSQT
ncbi:MAG: hypothetical protein FRX49_12043 [Trebouxia sp. A1-2]|nr:MAG: hypothetical protein FRX49_12043 [Trebouxia sp. A1-2]